jgi:hypothetical protein
MALHDQEQELDETLDDGDDGRDEVLEMRETLGDFAADLITTLEDHFLSALFASKPGQWLEVFQLCDEETAVQLEALEATAEDSPMLVCWMDYAVEGWEDDFAPGFCTITFFIESLLWSYTAIYNRALFLKKHTAQ